MIQLLSAIQQSTASKEPEVLSALPGKSATTHGLPGFFKGENTFEDVVDFLEELADLLEPVEQAETAATSAQGAQLVAALEDELEPALAELWLEGMQNQQETVVATRAELASERSAVGNRAESMSSAEEGEPTRHVDQEHLTAAAQFSTQVMPAEKADELVLPTAAQGNAQLLPTSAAGNSAEQAARIDMPLPPPVAAEQKILLPAAELETALTEAKTPRAAGIESATVSSISPAASQASPASAATDNVIRLQAPEAKWGEQMLQALRQHVQVSVQQNLQQAHIRLDPPELGSLEIHLSHEAGRLSVQIGAGQAEVARLLQQTSERLRHELMEQNFPQVDVHVFADGGEQQRHSQQQARLLDDDQPLAAVAQDAAGNRSSSAKGQTSDLLVTV